MRKQVALGIIAAMALGAQTAAAEGFSYNFIEGAYATGDLEGLDGDGFSIEGASELAPAVHVFSGLSNLDFEQSGVDLELDTISIGVGFNWGLSDNVDLVGGASFERVKVASDFLGESDSDSGYGLMAGIRGRVAESLELEAAIKYADFGDGDLTTFSAGGRWYFTPNFAVGAKFNKLDLGDGLEGDVWLFSIRYDFGDRM
jgi:opacity protein-like surface antigen